jgi:hypothetical protein
MKLPELWQGSIEMQEYLWEYTYYFPKETMINKFIRSPVYIWTNLFQCHNTFKHSTLNGAIFTLISTFYMVAMLK